MDGLHGTLYFVHVTLSKVLYAVFGSTDYLVLSTFYSATVLITKNIHHQTGGDCRVVRGVGSWVYDFLGTSRNDGLRTGGIAASCVGLVLGCTI